MPYRPRVVDAELEQRLASTGAVVIEGPKACGKTATARRAAASEVLLDVDAAAREALAVDPALVLTGATPRLVDEWQAEPAVWNHIRRAVDERGRPGQFILTGSAVPADDVTRHGGAGRVARVRMRPFSLFESGHSTGAVSLAALLHGEAPASPDPGLTVAALAERVAVGGWPGFLGLGTEAALRAVRDYLEEARRVDVGRVDRRRRDPAKVGRLFVSLARNTATYVSAATLAADAAGDGTLKDDTAREYLTALERLMLVEDQPPWAPHLRARSRVRGAPKRHFADPSLAAAALNADPQRLLKDLRWLGFLFESLVVRDLRVYAQRLGGRVLQYHDNTGLEVDAVVEADDGRWAAFEVKLGAGQVEEAAANLLKFAERVDQSSCGRPSALGVIVGAGYGYRRPDGVSVIPIGALGP
ncbi:MAG: ATP-binding protein [Elusimicrobia bacterium]|nr:ATP-binding protein [Elusimicrobiota bacterium]